MRAYLHYEGARGPAFTAKVPLEAQATILDVLERFLALYRKKLGVSLALETVDLAESPGKKKASGGLRRDALAVGLLRDKADYHVVDGRGSRSSAVEEGGSKARQSARAGEQATDLAGRTAPGILSGSEIPGTAQGHGMSHTALTALISGYTRAAAENTAQGKLRDARQLLEKALALQPDHRESLAALGRLHVLNKRFGAAVECLMKARSSTGTGVEAQDLGVVLELARALVGAHRYGDAVALLQPILEAGGGQGTAVGAADWRQNAAVVVARALFEAGRGQVAADMVQAALAGNEDHLEGLVTYAAIAERYGKNQEALGVLLRTIVAHQDHKEVRALLTRVLSTDQGLELLAAQVPCTANTASAYAFLATVVKEQGAVGTSLELLSRAHKAAPSNGSFALNYVHAFEILNDYAGAYSALVAFLRHNADSRVGADGVSCQAVLSIVGKFSHLSEAVAGDEPAHWVLDWKAGDNSRPSWGAVEGVPRETEGPSSRAGPGVDGPKFEFNDASLDLMAVFFTLVKILYVSGAWNLVIDLVPVIEPTRQRAANPLHLTNIRNEHAYYCCIGQNLGESAHVKARDLGAGAGTAPPIHICGDSHSMTTAWKTVLVQGTQRTLKPELVTGLKHWHLRPSTEFYPKQTFKRVVQSIPRGSDVVFMFGEIDCREGILVAVEKDRYDTVEEGMTATMEHFIRVAKDLVHSRGFRAFVHPIVPVLDQTRHLVKAYNALLRTRVQREPELHWLDGIFEELLTRDGKHLRPEFKLDGTHLHPRYLPLLGASLTKALPEV